MRGKASVLHGDCHTLPRPSPPGRRIGSGQALSPARYRQPVPPSTPAGRSTERSAEGLKLRCMALRSVTLALSFAVWPASAQIPASGTLSATDWPLFRAEVARVEKLLSSAPDKGAVTYVMARTWASAKQWPETVQWLRKVAGLRAGLDPPAIRSSPNCAVPAS